MESYQRAYPLILRLHMLTEIEHVLHLFFSQADKSQDAKRMVIETVKSSWEKRFEHTQAGLMGREPLLALRRVLFQMLDLKAEVADSWLYFAKAARHAGHESTAHSAIMQAERYGALKAHVERAKLKWSNPMERYDAVRVLREYIDIHSQSPTSDMGITAKAIVLHWKWTQELGMQEISQIIENFQEHCTRLPANHRESEKINFLLGHFFDISLFPDRTGASKFEGNGNNGCRVTNRKDSQLLPSILNHYATSLQYGHKYIFQSLPRLLTLWFENAENPSVSPEIKKQLHQALQKMKSNVPSYTWLSVFSQLISRICHTDPDVLSCLISIIASVFIKHPAECLWQMVAVVRSNQPPRRKPAREALTMALNQLKNDQNLRSKVEDILKAYIGQDHRHGFVDELVKLCNVAWKKDLKSKTMNIQQEGVNLIRMMKSPQMKNKILMPEQAMLIPVLPCDGRASMSHNPYPENSVFVKDFEEQVEVMQSVQKPVVVRILGSDGKGYRFLCKPNDDLRKDSRMMDFNTMINRLLLNDSDSRKRNLCIRTFAVVPLNETNGIIQWVNNTNVIRGILNALYESEFGKDYHSTKKISDMYSKRLKPKGDLHEIDFYRLLTNKYPPIFHKWFLNNFRDPATWVLARNAFVRSTAVWSMVGYVIGLGDRHAENILIESTSGDCIHVDFACIFNKGETLQVPERVPFRLTPNMIDPMGVCGYKGAFTSMCTVTMRILRDNWDSLMNVLETFAHDPLVEWIKKDSDRHQSESTQKLGKCERRLRGEVTRFPDRRDIRQLLSVSGQVRAVIAEAVDPENLSQMYKWWMPWL
ncbi:Rad3 DNA damage checkpoint [Guillardia theta CCMP2712]|uniref:Serine/threonine-protein kinase ATR n=2 Tax=Guillardia theta TaxID=55529 RepID=L1I8B8_GUITC|nr:Rad3 DNA damage checkpoint [Guillardia theta CCMP2712]EKX32302.1 Rad3 DNA damage checkpoint [Guillardia theta CCMP2712]|eukprot:XP_005819282.1 Rad3 DNA damage checkpoint [Guillardia theta CCMP2712]